MSSKKIFFYGYVAPHALHPDCSARACGAVEHFTFETGKMRGGGQRRPAQTKWKKRAFPAK